jgi:hypothetical protein
MSDFPPRPTPAEAAELRKRQRGRNVALILVLAGLAVLFFAITVAKLGQLG